MGRFYRKGLTAIQKLNTLNRIDSNGLTAPILRLAIARRLILTTTLEIETSTGRFSCMLRHVMDNRWILSG